jgi:aminoglycoside phosphotransferase
LNIPTEIKDLFPILIDYDNNNKWYIVEKINGVLLSSLYVNELLTTDNLKHVMNSIKRIQKVKINNTSYIDNLNIYDNYANKLKNRYDAYDYSKFKNHCEIFDNLFIELKNYETSGLGNCVVIHGDSVMTNILINNLGKIKFIDMRGELGKELTIYGDFLYDWAKLYQSLIGYDKILANKNMSFNYELNMIDYFEKYFMELYSEKYLKILKTIVKSLLFTLIPLHDNELCFRFYELIFKL